MSCVAWTAGLGNLASLPPEIRDQIYIHFMHWFNYRGDTEARLRQSNHYKVIKSQSRDNLAIFRTSRQLYDEASRLLYDNWTLDLRTTLAVHCGPYAQVHATWPGFFPQVIHPKLGTFQLPGVYGRPEVVSMGAILYFDIYRNMCFERWASVVLEIPAPRPCLDGGAAVEVMVAFRVSKVAAHIFQKHPPRSLLIRPTGPWHAFSETASILPHNSEEMNQGITPSPAAISALHMQGMELRLTATDSTGLCDWRTPILSADYVESWFDCQLDNFVGPQAYRVRSNRWCYWSKQYEKSIIDATRTLEPEFADQDLSSLTERWAVVRALDPYMLEADLEIWFGLDDEPHDMPSVTTRYCDEWAQTHIYL